MKIRLFHSSRPSSPKGKIDFWGRANISLSTVGLRLFFVGFSIDQAELLSNPSLNTLFNRLFYQNENW